MPSLCHRSCSQRFQTPSQLLWFHLCLKLHKLPLPMFSLLDCLLFFAENLQLCFISDLPVCLPSAYLAQNSGWTCVSWTPVRPVRFDLLGLIDIQIGSGLWQVLFVDWMKILDIVVDTYCPLLWTRCFCGLWQVFGVCFLRTLQRSLVIQTWEWFLWYCALYHCFFFPAVSLYFTVTEKRHQKLWLTSVNPVWQQLVS